jgi:HNH endonuclease
MDMGARGDKCCVARCVTTSTVCVYCHGMFTFAEFPMDHIVPLARGGRSTTGNVVPC